jgi:Tol biopolymer transport system component
MHQRGNGPSVPRTGVPAPDPQPPAPRLESWKEIAAYLNRGERTVRRWERTEGLPTHRHVHNKRATVYAFKSEIDEWWQSRGTALADPTSDDQQRWAGLLRLKRPGWIVTAVLAVLAGCVLWLYYRGEPGETGPSMLKVRPLTAYPGSERYPSFSPDGRQVAFAWKQDGRDDFDIYIQLIDSATPLQLTTDSRHDWSPAWSPDGRSIAFLRWSADSRAELILTPSLPGAERILDDVAPLPGRGPFYGSYLAWSPDGQWLAVIDKDRPGDPWGIHVIAVTSGEKRRLTTPPNGFHLDVAPAFSRDGRSLAFVRVPTFGVSELFVLELSADMHAAGSPRQMTTDTRLTTSPAWTSDGALLFASGTLWTERRLWKIANPKTAGDPAPAAMLVGDVADGFVVAISADSRHLIYAMEQFDPSLWRLERSEQHGVFGSPRTFAASTRIDCNPQFSPDGTRVAFESTRSGTPEIWVADADGSNPRRVTSVGGMPTGTPRWSPDGGHIAFGSGPQGQADIYVIRSEGGLAKRLTDDPANDALPSWSGDGRSIYFASGRSGRSEVWKIAIPDSGDVSARAAAIQVTRGGGLAAFESADGRMLFYSKATRDGMSLWQIPVGGGEEHQVIDSLRDWSSFALAKDGIYFFPRGNPAIGGPLRFLDPSLGTVRTVAELSRPVFVGLSVSRDARAILYSQVDREESDLMLVELLK